ncbi:alanine--tRNA ligase [Neomegalonema sp.]|uniref:alanine--tRNA ligase n=1 Tax=Neomegalonema sp. TaxID=2039713 RepID=UPI00263692C6|nr:alanine--tRNA ligase [Neomegalonema sp.]MDD2869557.1 alanine--tRNA ligase [Neomegalonema sp.]
MASLNDVRRSFLDFFVKNGHQEVASSPLVPRNDPTLMFTNAGMVQFKNVFTGLEELPYERAATSQKCVRAGGKHNDLNNVGYTARHHTFFEMLGNFSFGDYFKERAIPLAWELVTKEFGLPKDKLLVTVYHDDDAAADLWKKVAGLPDERIIRIATSDNFWSMGPTGPCGPCSEIFFDHGPQIPGGPPGSPDQDGDRFIEIWNLVFMQFEQQADGSRLNLPRPSIDTGMGLERVGAVLQGKHDNYDTDLMRSLILASAEATGSDPDGQGKFHHRVIADHLRATSFLIADGVTPSNEGRGYVLRRIMRRAMRHAHMLGAQDPVMWRLVPALTRQMGDHFPELIRAKPLIEETLKLEEQRFQKTLDRGLRLLDDELEKLGEGQPLSGEAAFKLYDTYGFPLDLTQDALREKGRSVDLKGFETAMAEQKAKARAAWVGSGEAADESVWFDLKEQHGATEFLGYETESAEGQILAILDAKGAPVDSLKAGETGSVVLNQTPFYAEMGGQEADHGVLSTEGGKLKVSGVAKKAGGVFAHLGEVSSGEIRVGQAARLELDHDRRGKIRSNHTATHFLHEALREQLGEHVAQKGSLVAADRFRFDFSHPKAMTIDDLTAVEQAVNAYIRQNDVVTTRVMTPDEAVAEGARALFGEKYGDEVRVVSVGRKAGGGIYSIELCGGVHVGRAGEIGAFKIVSEGATAAGVRRVEALSGAAALEHLEVQDRRLKAAAALLKAQPGQLVERLEALLEERKTLQAEAADLKKKLALAGSGGASAPEAEEVAGVKLATRLLSGVSGKELRGILDEQKAQIGSGVVALIAEEGGKPTVAIGVTQDLTAKISAVELVRAAVAALGGKGGGGRPDSAQGGGEDAALAPEAFAAVKARLAELAA